MRRTRLVILPGARCLTQMCALLLYLSCPNIGAICREHRDILRDDLYSETLLELPGNTDPPNDGNEMCYVAESRINCGTKYTENYNETENTCLEKLPHKFVKKILLFDKNTEEIDTRQTQTIYDPATRRIPAAQANQNSNKPQSRRFSQQPYDNIRRATLRSISYTRTTDAMNDDKIHRRISEDHASRKNLQENDGGLKQGTRQYEREDYNKRLSRQQRDIRQESIDRRVNERRLQKSQEHKLFSEQTEARNFRKSHSRRSTWEENHPSGFNLRNYRIDRREQTDRNTLSTDLHLRRVLSDQIHRLNANSLSRGSENVLNENERRTTERSFVRLSDEKETNRRIGREIPTQRVSLEHDLIYRTSSLHNLRLSREESNIRRNNIRSTQDRKNEEGMGREKLEKYLGARQQNSVTKDVRRRIDKPVNGIASLRSHNNQRLEILRSLNRNTIENDNSRRNNEDANVQHLPSRRDNIKESNFPRNRMLQKEDNNIRSIYYALEKSNDGLRQDSNRRLFRDINVKRISTEINNHPLIVPKSNHKEKEISSLIGDRSQVSNFKVRMNYERFNQNADNREISMKKDLRRVTNRIENKRLTRSNENVRSTKTERINYRQTNDPDVDMRLKLESNTRRTSSERNGYNLINLHDRRNMNREGHTIEEKRMTHERETREKQSNQNLIRDTGIRRNDLTERVIGSSVTRSSNNKISTGGKENRRLVTTDSFLDQRVADRGKNRRLGKRIEIRHFSSERDIRRITEKDSGEERTIRDTGSIHNRQEARVNGRFHFERMNKTPIKNSLNEGSSTRRNSNIISNEQAHSDEGDGKLAREDMQFSRRSFQGDSLRRTSHGNIRRGSSESEIYQYRNENENRRSYRIERRRITSEQLTDHRTNRRLFVDRDAPEVGISRTSVRTADEQSENRNYRRSVSLDSNRVRNSRFRIERYLSNRNIEIDEQRSIRESIRDQRTSDERLNVRHTDERTLNRVLQIAREVNFRKFQSVRDTRERTRVLDGRHLSHENEDSRKLSDSKRFEFSIEDRITKNIGVRRFSDGRKSESQNNENRGVNQKSENNVRRSLDRLDDSRVNDQISVRLIRKRSSVHQSSVLIDKRFEVKGTRTRQGQNIYNMRLSDEEGNNYITTNPHDNKRNFAKIINQNVDNGILIPRTLNRISTSRRTNSAFDNSRLTRALENTKQISSERTNIQQVTKKDTKTGSQEIGMNMARRSDNRLINEDLVVSRMPFRIERTETLPARETRRRVSHRDNVSHRRARRNSEDPLKVKSLEQLNTDDDYNRRIILTNTRRQNNEWTAREILKNIPIRRDTNKILFSREINNRQSTSRFGTDNRRVFNIFYDNRSARDVESFKIFTIEKSLDKRMSKHDFNIRLSPDVMNNIDYSEKKDSRNINMNGIIQPRRTERSLERFSIRERRMPETLRNKILLHEERADNRMSDTRNRRLFRFTGIQRNYEINSQFRVENLESRQDQQRKEERKNAAERVSESQRIDRHKNMLYSKSEKRFVSEGINRRRFSEELESRLLNQKQRNIIVEATEFPTRNEERFGSRRLSLDSRSRQLSSTRSTIDQNTQRLANINHFARRQSAEIKTSVNAHFSFDVEQRRNFNNIEENRNSRNARSLSHAPSINLEKSENRLLSNVNINYGESKERYSSTDKDIFTRNVSQKVKDSKLKNKHVTTSSRNSVERTYDSFLAKQIPYLNTYSSENEIDFWKIDIPLLENFIMEGVNKKSVLKIVQDSFSSLWSMKQETKAAVVGSVACFLLTSNVK